jgi:hypothetical protein
MGHREIPRCMQSTLYKVKKKRLGQKISLLIAIVKEKAS